MMPKKRRVPTILVVSALSLVALGCHLTGGNQHLRSIHSESDYEEYCIDTTDSSIDQEDFRPFLALTLYGAPTFEDAEDWHRAPDNRTQHVSFVPQSSYVDNCDKMPYQTWVHVIVKDSTSAECGGSNYSCVDQDDVRDPPVCDIEHCHSSNPIVYLKTSHVSGLGAGGRHVVNHEFGHVFGLQDPGDGEPDDTWTQCQFSDGSSDPFWIDSIMHAPDSYCESAEDGGQFRQWPTALDFRAAGSVIQQP